MTDNVLDFPEPHARHHHCSTCRRNNAPAVVGLCQPCLDALDRAAIDRDPTPTPAPEKP